MLDPALGTTELSGYSESTPDQILAIVETGRSSDEVTGDWTLVHRKADGLLTVSSPIAAVPVYYAVDPEGVAHTGMSVFEVARSARLPWGWYERAIRCLALFGHTLGRDTLHPEVHRIASDCVTTIRGGIAEERSLGFWDTLVVGGGSCRAVVDAMLRTVRGQCSDRPVLLSLSAGFDSRLLLALCLASDIRPRCVTMGPPDATDVEVAAEICRREGLEHERIELPAERYLSQGLEIARITSGVKLAANWHTYLYAKAAARDSPEVHLVGANGEFARNYYLHHPLAGRFRSAPALLHPWYWLARLERRRRKFRALDLVSMRSLFDTWQYSRRFTSTRGRLDEALARFYATQRVRHFIGAGLALYGAVGLPRAPFLDGKVVRELWRLPRAYWCNDRFHREAIGMTRPSLLGLPFNTPLPGRPSRRGYSPFQNVLRSPEARERIIESKRLGDLFPRAVREAACRRDVAAELLLTLAFAADAAT